MARASNYLLDQVIVENNLVLLSLVYFVKVREVIEIFAESAQC